jgi:nicotinate-nucleotide adenylyltransferase
MTNIKNVIKTIGILGGTFNPIHYGHIQLACYAKCILALDEVHFVINKYPPHKEPDVSVKHRLAMLRLTLKNTDFKINTIELNRNKKSYTIDTVKEYIRNYPKDKLLLILGHDYQDDKLLKSWREYKQLKHLISFMIAGKDFYCQKYAISSTLIRTSIQNLRDKNFYLFNYLNSEVQEYIIKHKLYLKKGEIRK